MDKTIIVTTSWDDGARQDFKVLDLLGKYKIKGTFYIPKIMNCKACVSGGMERISDSEIKAISLKQEIGAHSLSHEYFGRLNNDRIRAEVLGSKEYLESLLGKKVKMFCYPGGVFNKTAENEIKEAGFIGARTCESFVFEVTDPYHMGTTTHCYPFPFRKNSARAVLQPLSMNFKKIIKLKLPLKSFVSWSNLAKALFDYSVKNGQIFHLWGHSWEVEKNKMWDNLENVLEYISDRPEAVYMTNSEAVEFLTQKK